MDQAVYSRTLPNKYLGIKKKLQEEIASDIYDGVIPSGKYLARKFNANIKTIDKAVKALEQEGKLRREKGKGTFIVKDNGPAPESSSKPRFIGVLSPRPAETIEDSWLSPVLSGIQSVPDKDNINVIMKCYDFSNGLSDEKKNLKSLLDSGISGLVAYPFISSNGITNSSLYRKLKIPVVFFDRYLDDLNTDFAGIDHFRAGMLAAEFLIARGHRRMAYIGSGEKVKNTEDRANGFKTALSQAGIPFPKEFELKIMDYDKDKIKSFLTHITASGNDSATAVCASHDGYSLAVYGAAKELGLDIPNDISLIGFGNSAAGGILNISSIDQSLFYIGRAATKMLSARLEEDRKDERVIHQLLPVQLIARGSVKKLN
ncbi:MAG: substrate-binding domain-containing protein [Victivallales bacterium]